MTRYSRHAATLSGRQTQGKRALRRPLNRRRPLLHGSRSLTARQEGPHTVNVPVLPQPEAFDPDMLYVECGHCGAPIVWEKGRTRRLLAAVGIDPLELDASCVLITDSCPLCGGKGRYTIQIYRISAARSGPSRVLRGQCLIPVTAPKQDARLPREAGVLSSGFPACGPSCRPPGDNMILLPGFLPAAAGTPRPRIPGLTAVLSKGWGLLGPPPRVSSGRMAAQRAVPVSDERELRASTAEMRGPFPQNPNSP